MFHKLYNKIQRVSDLIAEYDEGEDRFRNPNPALHDFVQKLKFIVNAETEITRKDKTNYSNSESSRIGGVSPLTSSSSPRVDSEDSNSNPKVIEALGNHVVLTEIFKCGSVRDLNNFRLINKQWKAIANSAIIERRLWKLSIEDKFGVFKSNRNEALSDLNDCVQASEGSFPLTALDFTDVDCHDVLNDAGLLRFFVLMGPSIKHVKLHNVSSLTINEFQDLLVNKMPNVDHIDAGNIVLTDQEKCYVPIFLPYLKTIRFIVDPPSAQFSVLPYYKVLLQAATNLKEILDFRVQLTDTVIESGKMDCVQTFRFALELMTSSALCAQFSHTEPKLKSLNISRSFVYCEDDDDEDDYLVDLKLTPELAECLKRILISSKDTLKHFQYLIRVFPVDFKLPKFSNLEYLTVLDDSFTYRNPDELSPIFPAGCDFSEIFPKLHTVSFDSALGFSFHLGKYFPGQAFPSVTTLETDSNFEVGSSLKIYFPNVSHIKIVQFRHYRYLLGEKSDIGGFHSGFDNQIESLELHQCQLGGSGNEFTLDSLYTGVPSYICPKLLQMHNNCKIRDVNENIRFVKEILEVVKMKNYKFRNCEGLRRLKIMFNHKDNVHFRISKNSASDLDSEIGSGSGIDDEKVETTSAPVISPVSCVFGFSLMPNLEQVIIGYDHYLPNASDIAEVFKPFAQFSYVKIIHEPTKLSRMK